VSAATAWTKKQLSHVDSIASHLEKVPIVGSAARAITAPARALAGAAKDAISIGEVGASAIGSAAHAIDDAVSGKRTKKKKKKKRKK